MLRCKATHQKVSGLLWASPSHQVERQAVIFTARTLWGLLQVRRVMRWLSEPTGAQASLETFQAQAAVAGGYTTLVRISSVFSAYSRACGSLMAATR